MLTHACLHLKMQKILFILRALHLAEMVCKELQDGDTLDASAIELGSACVCGHVTEQS